MMNFFILNYLLLATSLIAAQELNHFNHFCSSSKYSQDSLFSRNLITSLDILYNNGANSTGFFTTNSGGNIDDKVYTLFLCRGDINSVLCQSCLKFTSIAIRTYHCPLRKEAIIWYNVCMIRYSNQNTTYITGDIPLAYICNEFDVIDPVGFHDTLTKLMRSLVTLALSKSKFFAFGDSSIYLSNSSDHVGGDGHIYGLVQCIPNIPAIECNNCLLDSIGNVTRICDGKRGAVFLTPSCNVRYELFPFYQISNITTNLSSSNPPQSDDSKCGGNWSLIVVTTLVTVSYGALIIGVCAVKKVKTGRREGEVANEISCVESLEFDLDSIKDATNNFSEANVLGRGGFGPVYKGILISSGQEVAVKRLSVNSSQGDREFKNEIVLVSKLQHRNLVKLLGFCSENSERLIIYEFVPNGSLDQFIFDPIKQAKLDSRSRYKIIVGIARGLQYLHEDSCLRIIHRDLKASNVLLDRDMNPKISDFGLAKLFPLDQTHDNTSKIMGTYGYMAPEYVRQGHYSIRIDVFSFGVMILEIVSGQRNGSTRNGEYAEHSLSKAWKCWVEGRFSEVIDPMITDPHALSTELMIRCIHIGLLCVQENEVERPSMGLVVHMLNTHNLTLPIPTKPAFFMHSNTQLPTDDVLPNSKATNGASITDLYPR